ncbi:MAG: hypothetical protein QNJ16_03615 [Rhodobacter sp.]|nr:hypothetical protein [Rhodobacter sp.]
MQLNPAPIAKSQILSPKDWLWRDPSGRQKTALGFYAPVCDQRELPGIEVILQRCLPAQGDAIAVQGGLQIHREAGEFVLRGRRARRDAGSGEKAWPIVAVNALCEMEQGLL